MQEQASESVVDVLTSDHRAVAAGIARIRAVLGEGHAEVQATTERLVTQIVGLLVAEEQYLLPQLRRTLPDGAAAAGKQFDRHRALEHQLRRLEDLDDAAGLVDPILADVQTSWQALTGYLELEAFPILTQQLPPQRLADLGDEVLGAIQTAPTRPREFAPRSPALSKVVSLAEGFVDRARDAVSDRGQGGDDAGDPERDEL